MATHVAHALQGSGKVTMNKHKRIDCNCKLPLGESHAVAARAQVNIATYAAVLVVCRAVAAEVVHALGATRSSQHLPLGWLISALKSAAPTAGSSPLHSSRFVLTSAPSSVAFWGELCRSPATDSLFRKTKDPPRRDLGRVSTTGTGEESAALAAPCR